MFPGNLYESLRRKVYPSFDDHFQRENPQRTWGFAAYRFQGTFGQMDSDGILTGDWTGKWFDDELDMDEVVWGQEKHDFSNFCRAEKTWYAFSVQLLSFN